MLLGASEAADNPAGLFRTLDRTARIYQTTANSGGRPRLLPRLLGPIRVREHMAQIGRSVTPTAAFNDAIAHRRALEKIAPPSILVDETHRVVHLSETAGRFLQPSGGSLTGDVVDLVRSELRFELRSALHRIFEQQALDPQPADTGSLQRRPASVLIQVKAAETTSLAKLGMRSSCSSKVRRSRSSSLPSGESATDETVRRLTQELE